MTDNKSQHISALSDRDILLMILDEMRKMNGRVASLEWSRSWFKGWIAAFTFLGIVLAAIAAARALGAF